MPTHLIISHPQDLFALDCDRAGRINLYLGEGHEKTAENAQHSTKMPASSKHTTILIHTRTSTSSGKKHSTDIRIDTRNSSSSNGTSDLHVHYYRRTGSNSDKQAAPTKVPAAEAKVPTITPLTEGTLKAIEGKTGVKAIEAPPALAPSAAGGSKKGGSTKAASAKAPTVKAPTVKALTVKAASVKAPTVKAASIKANTMEAATIKVASVKATTVKAASVKKDGGGGGAKAGSTKGDAKSVKA